jgi:predicted Na+-dependent transporter
MRLQITYSEGCKLYTNKEFLHVDILKQVMFSYHLILIFRWFSKKWDVGAWTGLIWLRIGTDVQIVNAIMYSGSTKCGKFLDYLRTC